VQVFEYFVIGSRSQIARSFAEKLEEMQVSYKGFSRNQGSIDTEQIFGLISQSSQSKVVYFCSVTDPVVLESNPEESEYINATLPGEIAKIARDAGSSFLAISSTRVFDGKTSFAQKTQEKSADTVYGQMKSKMEDLVLNANGSILRMTKVLQPAEKFLQDWARDAFSETCSRVHRNQFIAPVFLTETTGALTKILDLPSGLYQMSRMEEFSYLELHSRFASYFEERFAIEVKPPTQVILSRPRHDSLCVDGFLQDLLLDFHKQFSDVLENLTHPSPDFHRPS